MKQKSLFRLSIVSALSLLFLPSINRFAQAQDCLGRCSYAKDYEQCVRDCRPTSTEWYCLCYQKILGGQPREVTSCYQRQARCDKRYELARGGAEGIVKGSQKKCYRVRGEHPALGTDTQKKDWASGSEYGLSNNSGCHPAVSKRSSPQKPERKPKKKTKKKTKKKPTQTPTQTPKPDLQSPDPCAALRECETRCGEKKCSEQGQCMITCQSDKEIPSTCSHTSIRCTDD